MHPRESRSPSFSFETTRKPVAITMMGLKFAMFFSAKYYEATFPIRKQERGEQSGGVTFYMEAYEGSPPKSKDRSI